MEILAAVHHSQPGWSDQLFTEEQPHARRVPLGRPCWGIAKSSNRCPYPLARQLYTGLTPLPSLGPEATRRASDIDIGFMCLCDSACVLCGFSQCCTRSCLGRKSLSSGKKPINSSGNGSPGHCFTRWPASCHTLPGRGRPAFLKEITVADPPGAPETGVHGRCPHRLVCLSTRSPAGGTALDSAEWLGLESSQREEVLAGEGS